MIRQWGLPSVFWFAVEAAAPLSAEVPPGPKWLETAVFYQVYPQSYYDSNGDGIGDLPGITAKLDYIYSIGCNAIWINPIFESPFGDAGYDVADFYKVASRYGTNNDFKNLCAEAHKRGMHVCIDLVAGHTSVVKSMVSTVCSQLAEPLLELVYLDTRCRERYRLTTISRQGSSSRTVLTQLLSFSTGPQLRLRRSKSTLATSDHRSRLRRGA